MAETDGATAGPAEAGNRLPKREPLIRTIAMPADTNPAGDIFGGWLMAQMDLAAGNVAARRSRGRAVTASVEGMSFLAPVHVGDEVSLYGRIVKTGRSSMRIFIEAFRRMRDAEVAVKVTEATFTFVAVTAEGHSRPLPPEAEGCCE